MALCTGNSCHITQPNDVAVLKDGPMEIGDIYMVCAAVKHPLLDRLRNSSRRTVGTCLSTLMEDSLRMCRKKAARQAGRPCLICDTSAVTGDELPRICLMRIFETSEIDTMPAMLRHYLVPVYISDSNSKHDDHLHTSPEWPGKSQQWVVAAPFVPPEGSLSKRLKTPSSSKWPNGSNHYIGGSAMQEFMRLCQDKVVTWEAQSRSAYLRDLAEINSWKPTRKRPQRFIPEPIEEDEVPVDDVTKQLQAFSMKSEVESMTSDAASMRSKTSVKMLGLMRLRAGGVSRTRLSQAIFSRG